MDTYKATLHGLIGCSGGLYCPVDRPHPTSSAGCRRLHASKTLTRRIARRRANRDVNVD